MNNRAILVLLAAAMVVAAGTMTSIPKAAAQTEFTLAGGTWVIVSSPIDNEVVSRMGNTLGFPERHMVFSEDGGLRTGQVNREDAGPNVKPLGVWRINGNRFSAQTFFVNLAEGKSEAKPASATSIDLGAA